MSERCQLAFPFGLMVMPSHAGDQRAKLQERAPVFADAGRSAAEEPPPRREPRPPARWS